MFKCLIKKTFPEYDENMNYGDVGDILVLNDNMTVVIKISHGLQKFEAIVLKSGFYFKDERKKVIVTHNQLKNVPKKTTDITYMHSDFMSKKAIHAVGDIIEVYKDCYGVVKEVVSDGYYVFCLRNYDATGESANFIKTYAETSIFKYSEIVRYYGATRVTKG